MVQGVSCKISGFFLQISFRFGKLHNGAELVPICQRVHLHIWDEPLNFMDVISRTQLEELLLTFKPTILFVEHDKMFCEHIATKYVDLG